LTAAICIAAAAAIRGTLVEEAVHRRAIAGGPLVLQHPTGQIEVTTSLKRDAGNGPRFERISVARTARRLFDGVVQV
jgi:2-methylaconitate cis-trans-isomerase PrpF